MDFINREDLLSDLTESVVFTVRDRHSAEIRGARKIIDRIEAAPTVDAVSLGVYEQVMWERDQAIDQLNSIGKGFGEKMDDVVLVVRCRDCCASGEDGWICCGSGMMPSHGTFPHLFCSEGKRKDDDVNG